MENLNLDKFLNVGGAAFLKAKDVSGQKCKFVVVAVRELNLPNSGDTVVLDGEVKKKAWGFPLNTTNLKKMIELHGAASSKWPGKILEVRKVLVTNPKTKKEVEGLRIK